MCSGILPVVLLCFLSQNSLTERQARAQIGTYQRVFDRQYQKSRDELDKLAAHPDPRDTYYTFQFALMGYVVDARSDRRQAVLGAAPGVG